MTKQRSNSTTSRATVLSTTPRSIRITAVLALLAVLALVSPYLTCLLFSILIAYIFNPVYKLILQRTHRAGAAIAATFVVIILAFIIPATLIVGVTISQANTLADQFRDQAATTSPADSSEDASVQGTDRINSLIDSLPGSNTWSIDEQQVVKFIRKAGAAFFQAVANFIKYTGQTIADLTTVAILAFFIVAAILRHQDTLLVFIRNLSPFDDSLTDSYLEKAGLMTKAIVKGQLVIALAQGAASAFSLWLVGLDYFWFGFVVLSFLSFIPLGAGIITTPIGIIMILTGHPWQGVFIILFHVLVVTNIDNLLRPYLVPKKARLNPAVLLLAVFSGMALFGAAGIIYGPILMILATTSLGVYAGYNQQTTRPRPLDQT